MRDLLSIGTSRGCEMIGTGIGLGLSGFRVNPPGFPATLDLNFATTLSLSSSSGITPSFSRASTATYFNSAGVLTSAAINGPRFDHVYNGSSWVSKGLLVEEQRTNILLDSATLSTQSVTTTGAAYTLSFYGTGTATLSGTSTAGPLVGTGASNRVSLSFTPTAGTLTLTVSGTISNVQLELGTFATSYIPTTTASVTRSADVCQITGTDFSGFWNASEGSVAVEYDMATTTLGSAIQRPLTVWNSGYTSGIVLDNRSAGTTLELGTNAGIDFGSVVSPSSIAFCYKNNDFAASRNGAAVLSDLTGTVPSSLVLMNIGNNNSSLFHNGHISRLRYYNKRLTNSQLQGLST